MSDLQGRFSIFPRQRPEYFVADDAEFAAPVTIGFQPHAPPIQVVVVLSW
jgi:hypothetical protein